MENENEERTLSLVMNKVAKNGYEKEFHLDKDKMFLDGSKKEYYPADLTITKSYRFEGDSNPDDMAVLYLIHATDGEKGMLIDAYGTYSSRDLSDFLKNVTVDQEDESREN
jgi:hypothetical protein